MRQPSRRFFLRVILAVSAGAAGTAHAAAPQYELTLLPDSLLPNDINNKGQIVGGTGDGKTFVYADGKVTVLQDPLLNDSMGFAINDHGAIVGHMRDALGTARGFVYRDGTVTTLPVPADSHGARGINNAGQVLGFYIDRDFRLRAFVYSADRVKTLFPHARESAPIAINERGQVFGSVSFAPSRSRMFIHHDGKTRLLPDGFHGLGPHGINRWGHVVGRAQFGSATRAVRYRAGALANLGALTENDTSVATAVNDAGRVVGWSWNDEPLGQRAFIHLAGRMIDLNRLTPRRGGLLLTAAIDINAAGQIIGDAAYPGEEPGTRKFLLTPIRKPAAATAR